MVTLRRVVPIRVTVPTSLKTRRRFILARTNHVK